MNAEELFRSIQKKRSYLCIGLDTDYNKIPRFLLDKEYPIFEFNRHIIDATEDLAVAFKPNLAFYESMGAAGLMSLEMTINYIRRHYPDIFIIADAKRGDIGNSSKMYANAYFRTLDFDAVTVSPYMGYDSIQPFLECRGKWAIILALTSNEGSKDFQQQQAAEGQPFYIMVIRKALEWGHVNNMMFVIGATKAEEMKEVRRIIPEHFLLVPGVGEQGGVLEDVAKYGMNDRCGLIVNAGRSIIYADGTNKFEKVARDQAIMLQQAMEKTLRDRHLI
ncbi:MAG: orotidine-5'-phosphate decarboxylase [Bacteroidales bacterium]|nr:orotidine-5'-phosphate decarboxylase [Bacteroidales bacterium]MBN2697178.1 orotidine-5'-phosphate decarboxylase [Bacteroidales bacterium]